MSAALAARADDWGSLSASVDVTSDYRFRGLSGNQRDPALQGGVDWSDDGWRAGMWTSNVDFGDHEHTRAEVDVSAGKEVELRGSIIDFTVTYYTYPLRIRPKGEPVYSFAEAALKASHSFGKFGISGELAWSPDSFGESGMSWYVAAGATYQLEDWLSASANVGEQWVRDLDRLKPAGYPYTHWDAGLTASYGKFSLDLRYIDSSLSRRNCQIVMGAADLCSATGVATLTWQTGGE